MVINEINSIQSLRELLDYTAYEIMTHFKGQIFYVTFRTGILKLSYKQNSEKVKKHMKLKVTQTKKY